MIQIHEIFQSVVKQGYTGEFETFLDKNPHFFKYTNPVLFDMQFQKYAYFLPKKSLSDQCIGILTGEF